MGKNFCVCNDSNQENDTNIFSNKQNNNLIIFNNLFIIKSFIHFFHSFISNTNTKEFF